MINLMVAIVSKAFEEIDEVKRQASLKEKAALIADNISLLSEHVKNNYCYENQYLLWADYTMKTKAEEEEE
jgi:hypothetical protein